MCYVDDSLAALLGTEKTRRRNAALMVLTWEALGFKLAYAKRQLSQEVTWIGGTLRADPEGVRAWIKESLGSDSKSDLERLMAGNVISNKELHSVVGKFGACWRTTHNIEAIPGPSLGSTIFRVRSFSTFFFVIPVPNDFSNG